MADYDQEQEVTVAPLACFRYPEAGEAADEQSAQQTKEAMESLKARMTAPLEALRSLRDAFGDAEKAPGPSGHLIAPLMSLGTKAGRILFLLINSGEVEFKGQPDRFRKVPTIHFSVMVANDDPIKHTLDRFDVYWLAFIGWAAHQDHIPIETEELHTQAVFRIYRPGMHVTARSTSFHLPSAEDCPRIYRASIRTIDHLIWFLQPIKLVDPIPVVWVVEQIGKAAGRSDKLADKMKRRNYPVVKSANKYYCQRKDAMAMFPRHRHRLEANPSDEL